MYRVPLIDEIQVDHPDEEWSEQNNNNAVSKELSTRKNESAEAKVNGVKRQARDGERARNQTAAPTASSALNGQGSSTWLCIWYCAV